VSGTSGGPLSLRKPKLLFKDMIRLGQYRYNPQAIFVERWLLAEIRGSVAGDESEVSDIRRDEESDIKHCHCIK
jgi:hypothetical protein